MTRRNPNRASKRLKLDSSEGLKLGRDLDGFVHTPRGFIAETDYRKLREENPAAGLPEYENIPPLEA